MISIVQGCSLEQETPHENSWHRVGQNILFPLPFFKQGMVLITPRGAGKNGTWPHTASAGSLGSKIYMHRSLAMLGTRHGGAMAYRNREEGEIRSSQ